MDEEMNVSEMVDTAAETIASDPNNDVEVDLKDDIKEDVVATDDDAGIADEDEPIEGEEEVVTGEEEDLGEESEVVIKREAPKSWAKEQHEKWADLPAETQDYIEKRERQMLDGLDEYKEMAHVGRELNNVISPYNQMFQQANTDIKTGIQYLLQSQHALQMGTHEHRKSELMRIAQQFGVNLTENAENTPEPLDPRVEQMQNTITELQNSIRLGQQNTLTASREATQAEVAEFASDPSNLYFDELADEIAVQISAGKDLKSAYETAVYANPDTRAKEVARIQTENAAKLKEKRRLEAEKAKKATANNVRAMDTTRTPTEKKGKLFSKEHEEQMHQTAKKALGG